MSGSESAQTIFLPGASGDTQFWRPLASRLRHGGRGRFVGWPGFGGLPADPQVRGIADLAARVTLEITDPVNIFAQSMGGIVALLAALERPDLVRHLVLSATSGGIDMSSLRAFDWRRQFRQSFPTVPRWFEDERWNLADRLPDIRAPVLLLWGDADPISPVSVGQRLAQLLPHAELVVIPGGTHDLAAECVDDILPHVHRLLLAP